MLFSDEEIAGLEEAQEVAMMDTGYRLIQTEAVNDYGEVEETWSRYGDIMDCGIEMRPGSETHREYLSVVEYDATLRFPTDVFIGIKDHFELVTFRGKNVSMEFEVVQPLQRGISANRVRLRVYEV